jgi:hypothetical protein
MKVNLSKLLRAKLRVLLVGKPGLAKTARVLEAAKEAGYRTVIFRTSLSERVDLGGCLVPDVAAGVTVALPLQLLADLKKASDKVLVFLDDLGQAPMDVQAATMSLFDKGTLPENVVIWGATNRPGDKAGVTSLCEPLRSRFHVAFAIASPGEVETSSGATFLGTWKDEVDGWCEWAAGEEFAAEIVAWHAATTGRTLYAWQPAADPAQRMADFRSWETVAKLWAAGIRDLSAISAAIGKPAAAEFLAFASLADKLPTPAQVWLDPEGAPVPDEPAAQFLIASMLARSAEAKFARQLVTYFSRLPRVQAAFCARSAFKRLGAKLAGSAEWQAWFLANSALFSS